MSSPDGGSGTGVPFRPRVALASLSGEADAAWARAGGDAAGAAFLGGIAVDEATRVAARRMVADRDREEFLPSDPVAFVDDQLSALDGTEILAGVNVRTTTLDPLRRVAGVCRDHGAVLELNAHCRQSEMCAVGAGERLLRSPDRLCEQVAAAVDVGAVVSVKVRAEVPGVALPELCCRLDRVGADLLHVDAMDSEAVVREVAAATEAAVIANNGVRDRATVREYLSYGADAVSVGRPSDDPAVLERVRTATEAWFRERDGRDRAGTGDKGESTDGSPGDESAGGIEQ